MISLHGAYRIILDLGSPALKPIETQPLSRLAFPLTLVAMREGEKTWLHADRAAPFGAHPPSCLEKNSNGARLDRSGLGSSLLHMLKRPRELFVCLGLVRHVIAWSGPGALGYLA